jgi:hypothetical protein
MKFFRKISVCAAVTLALASGAAFSENPYTQILTRNVFDLNPSAPDASSTPPELLPTITPNGIMSIFGSVQTLFKVTDNQPGKPAMEKSFILGEGQRADDIEVIKIDEKNAVITFNNHGTIQEMPLVTATSAGGSPNAPGIAGQPVFPKPVTLNGYRFTGSAALALRSQMPDNGGNAPDPSGLGAGYTGSSPKNNISSQRLNASGGGNNPSVQDSNVSGGGSDENNPSVQESNVLADEHLSNLRMTIFAQQRMQ